MTATPNQVTLTTVLSRSEDVLHQEVGGEAVLLDLASESYFGLDPVGTRIWDLLDGSTSIASVHAQLCREYDADAARIEQDVLLLCQSLLVAGLVAIP